jgi:hypothetical protein
MSHGAIIRNLGGQMARFTISSQIHHKYSFARHYFPTACDHNSFTSQVKHGRSKMIYKDSTNDHPPVCHIVPGYAFYSGIGYGLAENLTNLIEWLIGFRR